VNPWHISELTSHLQSAFQAVSGERPEVQSIEDTPTDCAFRWRQPFSTIGGALWITAEEGSKLEILKDALTRMARALSGLLDREVRCEGGEERPALPPKLNWIRFDILIDSPVSFLIGAESDFMDAISQEPPQREGSKTFDLLLDVELPVSVSFGRAQVPLKDVLKLTTGSIVELNRTVGDPVEVIVNNCVIARGEVVTVEGNFGVRIHQVISRQERLRTLK